MPHLEMHDAFDRNDYSFTLKGNVAEYVYGFLLGPLIHFRVSVFPLALITILLLYVQFIFICLKYD